jgi:NAD(P)-dependent dehydrogenase (short-subunit alcohol dehydrogenase family)
VYSISKVAVIALTRIQQCAFDQDSRKDLIVSAVCPGYCKTDLTAHLGQFTAEEDFYKLCFLTFVLSFKLCIFFTKERKPLFLQLYYQRILMVQKVDFGIKRA